MKKKTFLRSVTRLSALLSLIFVVSIIAARAQTTTFTYQGKLSDGAGAAANGNYNMQFALFGSVGGNDQIGSTITVSNVPVSNGVFTAQLNFTAANAFDGSERYLEISVFNPATSGYVKLTPRQPITSSPYAIQTIRASVATNAENLGGVAANQFVQTNDSRLTDARTPTAGSSNYVQNTTVQQSANFNVSGNGTIGGLLTTRNVLARGGAPGGFGNNNNGYAFNGNGGDNDSGLFSETNGRVSLFSDAVERVRVDGSGLNVTGNINTTGTISGTLADNSVGTAQVADGSLRLTDTAVSVTSVTPPALSIGAHTCLALSGSFASNSVANDIVTLYPPNTFPAGLHIQPTVITDPASVTFNFCNMLNTTINTPNQAIRAVVTRP